MEKRNVHWKESLFQIKDSIEVKNDDTNYVEEEVDEKNLWKTQEKSKRALCK